MPLSHILYHKDFLLSLINLNSYRYKTEIINLSIEKLKSIIEIIINVKYILINGKDKQFVNKCAKLISYFGRGKSLNVHSINRLLIKYRLQVQNLIKLVLDIILVEISLCVCNSFE